MQDDKVLGATVRIDLTTHDSTAALVAPSSAFASDGSDFRIYKDGSAAQKTTQNGITVTSPFDSITGKHLIEIDTSNSTGDDGFWAVGSEYRVEINSAKTVAGIVQSGVVVGRFALVAAGVLRPKVDGRTIAVAATTGAVELDSDAQAMVTAFNAMRSGNVFTAPALANAPTGGSGSGSGARTVTITVNDGTTVLENCIVRLTEGANTFTALTNSSGVAVFNLDDATYTVGITKPGYTYSGTSLVVNGTEAETYSMTAISISNPTAGKVARRSIPVTVVDRVT